MEPFAGSLDASEFFVSASAGRLFVFFLLSGTFGFLFLCFDFFG
jgi:hypothetical protein